jgi:lipopolysaccharide export LptBFGC system permease protein LptF
MIKSKTYIIPAIAIAITIAIVYFIRNFILFPYLKENEKKSHIHIQNSKDDQVTVFYPGNSMSIAYTVSILPKNKNYIVINYRSRNSGFTSSSVAIKNGIEGYKFALQNYKHVKVVTFSIGNGVFSEVLKETKINPESIVSIAGLPNLSVMTYYLLGYLSYPLNMIFTEFETQDNYNDYLDAPYTMVHGVLDNIIPFQFGENMYKTLKRKGKNVAFEKLENYSHNDIRIPDYL